jgi:ATP-binding cassette subfamily F protein 3
VKHGSRVGGCWGKGANFVQGSCFEYSGNIKLGHNVQFVYIYLPRIKQNILMASTLLQTMEDAATDTNRSKVRDMLGSFL